MDFEAGFEDFTRKFSATPLKKMYLKIYIFLIKTIQNEYNSFFISKTNDFNNTIKQNKS